MRYQNQLDTLTMKGTLGSFTRRHMILSSGVWTVPAGVYEICVHACGGGGGGEADAGGSSGIEVFATGSVTPGQSLSVVIGAGGSGFTTYWNGENTVPQSATAGGTTTCGPATAPGGAARLGQGTNGAGGVGAIAGIGIWDCQGATHCIGYSGAMPEQHTLNGGPGGSSSLTKDTYTMNNIYNLISYQGATGGGGATYGTGGCGASCNMYGYGNGGNGRLGGGGGGGGGYSVAHGQTGTGGNGGAGWVVIYY